MTRAQVKAKLETIRDNILNDLATDSGEKFRIRSFAVGNGQTFTYATRESALDAVREIEGMIAQCASSGGGFFALARVMGTTG